MYQRQPGTGTVEARGCGRGRTMVAGVWLELVEEQGECDAGVRDAGVCEAGSGWGIDDGGGGGLVVGRGPGAFYDERVSLGAVPRRGIDKQGRVGHCFRLLLATAFPPQSGREGRPRSAQEGPGRGPRRGPGGPQEGLGRAPGGPWEGPPWEPGKRRAGLGGGPGGGTRGQAETC